LAPLQQVLLAEGFAAVPGWTELPGMLWVSLDEASGRFLVLEITDEVSFGPAGMLRTSEASGCLARRHRDGPLWRLNDDDGFWALLLHCLLDKGFIPDHYRERLQSMAPLARTDGPFARILNSWKLGMPSTLQNAALNGAWSELEIHAGITKRFWDLGISPVDRLVPVRAGMRRITHAPRLLRRRRGLSVVLLGLNGAGKSTLAASIAAAFPFPVTKIYMGLWKSTATPDSEPTLLAAMARPFIAWARYLAGLYAQLCGHLVIFDRYTYDAMLAPSPPLLKAKRVYMWLLARSIPAPNLVFLLDLPGRVATNRKDEQDQERNEFERMQYLALAAAMPHVRVLDATREPAAVCASALSAIWDRYLDRWAAKPLTAKLGGAKRAYR
jgi:thymidylate kinase